VSARRKATRRDMIGRRIVDVHFEDMDTSERYGPGSVTRCMRSITLDNGRRVWFCATELDADIAVEAHTHATRAVQP
jgi:hypothetical protein